LPHVRMVDFRMSNS